MLQCHLLLFSKPCKEGAATCAASADTRAAVVYHDSTECWDDVSDGLSDGTANGAVAGLGVRVPTLNPEDLLLRRKGSREVGSQKSGTYTIKTHPDVAQTSVSESFLIITNQSGNNRASDVLHRCFRTSMRALLGSRSLRTLCTMLTSSTGTLETVSLTG